ncbi:OmpA family protein [Sulfuricaulis sp.]|jgi:chemotaxis protein MotB|uniref:OmpA/MotB family protein n=1 Tax=Sulfuricaulis sp. TaxID=2003553 RepID=UPI00355A6679
MKQILRVVLVTGVFLTGCVSTSTFDGKQAELAACQKQAKSDLDACNSARSELDTKLAAANQELGVFRQAAEARQSKLDALQNQEKQLRERLSKELTDKNVEIEQLRGQLSVRMLDKIVFKSGSADILPQGAEVLDKLADAIKDSTDTIRVEGHTDDTPISDKLKVKYPSNWELSAARASAVARYFETKHFINPKRLESLGFSMYHPVAPNDSDENKQRNRRVEIVLKPVAELEPAKEPAAAAPAPTTPAAPATKP